MCGICGIVAPDLGPGAQSVIDRQLDCLDHRGPDARGSFKGATAVISQNRLAIIDLVTGDPPITNEDGTVAAVLNGEIYNFRRLRDELTADGHRFSSRGDTEVIAHLAEQVPPTELARKLDGMFAFATWDERAGRLILGRDRVGKKPLYYWSGGGRLVFGSEIKALLADPEVPRRLDPVAIPAYLTFGYVPTPRTFFEGIRSLPPGHVLTFEPGGEPVVERYWEPPLRSENGTADMSLGDAAAQLRTLLEQAVERRLIADVPLGAFLSGGIDSSAIVAVMSSLVDSPVETFTIGFDDRDGFDERPYARRVAELYRTNHHEYVVHPDAVDLIERLVWHHDQPFGDSSAVPTYLLSEVTRRHVTVALSGDGGDELFAGYERFAAGLALRQYGALPAPVRKAFKRAVDLLPPDALRRRGASAQRFAAVAEQGLPDAYRSWISFVQDADRSALVGARDDGWALDDYRSTWELSRSAPHALDRLLDLNLRTYLVDDLLVKADRMSMANGLEVRSPFLDTDLLTFAISLPPQLKIRGPRLKRVLKAAVEELVPEEIRSRRKKGFGVPLDRWFREDLRAYVAATLGSPDARVKEHLAAEAVDRLIADHVSGARANGHPLWTLLTLEVFLRQQDW